MTAHAFDNAMLRLHGALTRRALSSRALTAALAVGVAGCSGFAEARKKRKKRKKRKQPPLVRNAFGCVDVGKPCRGDSANCCSGICEGSAPKKGKRDTSRCAAHNAADCLPEADVCAGLSPICGGAGLCFRTTGQASFCGGENGLCTICRRDTDCEAEFGLGAACVICTDICAETGGTFCSPAAS